MLIFSAAQDMVSVACDPTQNMGILDIPLQTCHNALDCHGMPGAMALIERSDTGALLSLRVFNTRYKMIARIKSTDFQSSEPVTRIRFGWSFPGFNPVVDICEGEGTVESVSLIGGEEYSVVLAVPVGKDVVLRLGQVLVSIRPM